MRRKLVGENFTSARRRLISLSMLKVPIRDLKQSTTAGATTAAVTKKVWGEYVSVVC